MKLTLFTIDSSVISFSPFPSFIETSITCLEIRNSVFIEMVLNSANARKGHATISKLSFLKPGKIELPNIREITPSKMKILRKKVEKKEKREDNREEEDETREKMKETKNNNTTAAMNK